MKRCSHQNDEGARYLIAEIIRVAEKWARVIGSGGVGYGSDAWMRICCPEVFEDGTREVDVERLRKAVERERAAMLAFVNDDAEGSLRWCVDNLEWPKGADPDVIYRKLREHFLELLGERGADNGQGMAEGCAVGRCRAS